MEKKEFTQVYKIDVNRLNNYYERIENQNKNLSPLEITAKFLINRSIGALLEDVLKILMYFQDKLAKEKNFKDFAFEWIRAQSIRLEYKKYLIRAQYPHGDLALAIDDCISKFFLEYNKYIRNLFVKDIYEYELSALYDIFFSPYEDKRFIIHDILERHKDNVPPLKTDSGKLITNIATLRSGLSYIIVKDYEAILTSRLEEKRKKEEKKTKKAVYEKADDIKFKGTLLERMIKTYCIIKKKISPREIENAAAQFLTSYFRFGAFFTYDDFKELLIQCLAEDINAGLTDSIKKSRPLDTIKLQISEVLAEFRKINTIKILDGLAWKNDFTPVIKKFVMNFIENLFKEDVELEKEIPKKEEEIKEIKLVRAVDHEQIDFSTFFDLNLEVDQFREKLENQLKDSNLGLIQKRNLIRIRVQEFTKKKREALIKK